MQNTAGHPICKHCKVPVISAKNLAAILGKQHKKGCPRRRMYG